MYICISFRSFGWIGWAEYVKGIKNRYNEELRIALSYRRWKTRQKMLKIMKTWRHQGHTHDDLEMRMRFSVLDI